MTDWQWDRWLDQFGLATDEEFDEYDDDTRENDCNA